MGQALHTLPVGRPGLAAGRPAMGGRAAWPALVLATLAGCGGGQVVDAGSAEAPATTAISPTVHVFKADLGGWAPNNGRWYSYQVSDTPCDLGVWFPTSGISLASCLRWLTPATGPAGAWISSTGPWWVDPNHRQVAGGDGFGYIHVLAFAQLPAGFRAPANLDGTVVHFSARIDEQFSTVAADSREGRRQGHVYFWFQTFPRKVSPCTPDATIGENCTRQSDYILTGGWDPAYGIDQIPPREERRFSLALKASEPAKWTCLGRGDNVKYDCMGLEQALKNAAYVGFVIAPVAPCPTVTGPGGAPLCDSARIAATPRDHLNLGRFELRGFEIVKAAPRASQARRVDFAEASGPAAADGWGAPRFAAATPFAAGSGVQMRVGTATQGLRLGLAADGGADTLAGAGVQIYLSHGGSSPRQDDDRLVVMARGASGDYDRAEVFWPYQAGDTVGLHLEDGALLVLKNDEVVYQAPSPCNAAGPCLLHPFVASFGGDGDAPPVYRY